MMKIRDDEDEDEQNPFTIIIKMKLFPVFKITVNGDEDDTQ